MFQQHIEREELPIKNGKCSTPTTGGLRLVLLNWFVFPPLKGRLDYSFCVLRKVKTGVLSFSTVHRFFDKWNDTLHSLQLVALSYTAQILSIGFLAHRQFKVFTNLVPYSPSHTVGVNKWKCVFSHRHTSGQCFPPVDTYRSKYQQLWIYRFSRMFRCISTSMVSIRCTIAKFCRSETLVGTGNDWYGLW